MDEVWDLAAAGEPEGTVVVAREQTAGAAGQGEFGTRRLARRCCFGTPAADGAVRAAEPGRASGRGGSGGGSGTANRARRVTEVAE